MYRSLTPLFKAEGIILKRKNIGEADRMMTVFTRQYGKLRLIAKGVRRTASRRAPHLEIFTRVELLIRRGNTMDQVSDVSPVAIFEGIRSDLPRVSIAYFYCELIDHLLAEKQEHGEVYELLTGALAELNAPGELSIYVQSREFALTLLTLLGFLQPGKTMAGSELQDYIETITERRLKSSHFAKELASS
jgi:DNA repair protein RecO (recombination protein O)